MARTEFGNKRRVFIDRPVEKVVEKRIHVADEEVTMRLVRLHENSEKRKNKHFEDIRDKIREFNKGLEEAILYDFDIDIQEFERM